MGLGLNYRRSGGGDFLPVCKYDARAGRAFRVDREDGQNNPVDITRNFKAVFDMENIEVGWIAFPKGAAPDFQLVPLGEEFPEEKLQEIRRELLEDAKADGALSLVKVQIQKQIQDMTGMMPGPDGNSAIPMQPTVLGDGDVMGDGMEGPQDPNNPMNPASQETKGMEVQAEAEIRNKLVTDAYGTKIPQRRTVDRD